MEDLIMYDYDDVLCVVLAVCDKKLGRSLGTRLDKHTHTQIHTCF